VQHASALLISDLHLTPSMPLTAQRFFDFCEKDASQVEAVFILGDLFEYWIGDDATSHSPFAQEVKRALSNLSTKTKTYYMHGNRDFLVGPDFIKKTGMTLLPDPSLVSIGGEQYLLAHGDALCTDDLAYQSFRNWTRKPWVQKAFLNLPLKWRRAIAQHLRSNSHAQYQAKTNSQQQAKMDVTAKACSAILLNHQCNKLIHGHTHLPGRHSEHLGHQEWQRWVLSDWDLDRPTGSRPRANTLLINAQGVHPIDLIRA
jgi:UDP-2,3-diacylglucosamine hydrolase